MPALAAVRSGQAALRNASESANPEMAVSQGTLAAWLTLFDGRVQTHEQTILVSEDVAEVPEQALDHASKRHWSSSPSSTYAANATKNCALALRSMISP